MDKNIVKYTNSQNGIDEKAFASKHNYFKNIQDEFRKRGFLLLVKPSDKNTFSIEYKDKTKFAELRDKAQSVMELFGIDNTKLKNHFIPLEKLLKVCLAFEKGGYYAFTKGSSVLLLNSTYYKEFSLNIDQLFTIDNMLKLYMIFIKAEEEKKNGDKRIPISYYVLGFMGKEYKELEYVIKNDKLKLMFANKNTFNNIFDFYKKLTSFYADEYFDEKGIEYNKMIKQEVDELILEKCKKQMLKIVAGDDVKKFINGVNR